MDNAALFFLIFNFGNRSPLLDSAMIFGAEYLIYLTFVLVFILAFKGGIKEKKALLLTLVGLGISLIIIKVTKLFYPEPRPFISYNFTPLINHTTDPTFPSTHTAIMATIAFSFVYYRSKAAQLLLILLLFVGLARVYVGVHYPLDVIGGIITGLVSTHLAWQTKKWLIRKIKPIKVIG